MLDKILIWDSAYTPLYSSEEKHNLVLWRSYRAHGCHRAISIPQLVEEHADLLRKRYLAWVYEIGETVIRGKRVVDHMQLRPGFSAWSMSLLTEKCNFAKSPQIDEAIRLLAFTEWMANKNVKTIVLVTSNKELAVILRHWCKKNEIRFERRRSNSSKNLAKPFSWVRKLYEKSPLSMRAVIWLIYQYQGRRLLQGAGQKAWRRSKGGITFVSYLFNLVPESAARGSFASGYWGNLPETLLKKGVPTNWLHIYVKDSLLPTTHDAAEQIRHFNREGKGLQNHVTVDSFFSLLVLVQVLRDWLFLLCKGFALRMHANMPELGQLDLWPLFKGDWRNSVSGVAAMSNVLNLNLFEAAFSEISNQRIGVYLLENQGWESGMCHAWKSNQHGEMIGFAHSTVRYWDLRYFFDSRSYHAKNKYLMAMPDRVAVNGPVAQEAYLEGGYPSKDLFEVEALRYIYLGMVDKRHLMSQSFSERPRKVLILGDYLLSNTLHQMKLLREIADDLPNIELTVKPHPACPIIVGDYPELKLKFSDQSLSDLLEDFDAAYTSNSTSGAVDAYSAGLKVISVLDPATLNLSPLRGIAGVRFVSSSEMLRDALLEEWSTISDLGERVQYFNVDSSLPRWQALLSNSF